MQFFKVDLKKHTDSSLKKSDGFLNSHLSQTYRGIPLRNERICLSRTANLRIFLENLQEWRPK